jgi:hypothetical protein
MAKKTRTQKFINIFKSRAGAAAQWITRARDTAADYARAATGQDDSRSRFLRSYNKQHGHSAAGRHEAQKLLRQTTKKTAGAINGSDVGKMYSFKYSAKWDAKLPYWDRFPLILVISPFATIKGKMSGAHFVGMNLHYISPRDRALLMDALNDNLMRNGFDESRPEDFDPGKMAALNYSLLLKASKNRAFRACIKTYIRNGPAGVGVQSAMAFVPGSEWENLIFLEMAQWKRNSDVSVRGIYTQSRSSR